MRQIARVIGVAAAAGLAATVATAASAANGGAVPAARAAVPTAGSWGTPTGMPGLAALNKGDAQVNSVSCAWTGSCSAGGLYTDADGHQQGFVAIERHGRWRRAMEVPGLGALNKGWFAAVTSVSCGLAGSCAAGGYYADRRGHQQGFVAVERNGRWRRAIEVPGLAALNTGRDAVAAVNSMSCPSAGNCAAGGDYTGRRGGQGFVAVERHGRWRRAIPVPGLAALNQAGDAPDVSSVSCAAAGSCAAGGSYADRHDHFQGFVAVERNGRWRRAIQVPGLGALNASGFAGVLSVSCAAAGSCAAGGDYQDHAGNDEGFVASERHGRWGRAIPLPGLRALNVIGEAAVNSVSCGSAGNCAAGGFYEGRGHHYQGFVGGERNGVWGKAIQVPGLGALNTGGDAEVNAVSCGSAGSCAAVGWYTGRGHRQQGFVAVERHGSWGRAAGVPGLAALNTGGFAEVLSVSCASAGNCAAGGRYESGYHVQGFVAGERHGVWGKAAGVPGLAALHKRGGDATVISVSCASAGNCAAGGSYHRNHHHQGFVATERNGRWGTAIEVPGLGALNTVGQAIVNAVSCGSAGNCAAGGDYTDRRGPSQGFVAVERNGRWGKAIEVPGLGALNKFGDAEVGSVSCGSAGSCAAGGYYTDGGGGMQGFVAGERDGVWGRAIEVPGLAALNKGNASVYSVSCASEGNCAAGGGYHNRHGGQGFVATERNGRWGTAIEVPGLGALRTGGEAWVSSVSCAPAGGCGAGGNYEERHDHLEGFVVSQTG